MHWTKIQSDNFMFVSNWGDENSAQYHHWLADGFSTNGLAKKLREWPASWTSSLSEVSSPSSSSDGWVSREGEGWPLGCWPNQQLCQLAEGEVGAGFPRNSAMRKSTGGLQRGMGNPGKVRTVVFRRQNVSWWASCEKVAHLQLPCGIKTSISCSPSSLPSTPLSGKGRKSWWEAKAFVSPAQPPPFCWQVYRSSQNMRTLLEKGFTACFKTQDWNSQNQSGGIFGIGLSLKRVFAVIFTKEMRVFYFE